MPGVEISAEQLVLLGCRFGIRHLDGQVVVAAQAAALRAVRPELADRHADRLALGAALAGGAVNERTAAAKVQIHERVIEAGRESACQERHRAAGPFGKIGAGALRAGVDADWGGGPGDRPSPPGTAASTDSARRRWPGWQRSSCRRSRSWPRSGRRRTERRRRRCRRGCPLPWLPGGPR